jgi:hypothetical protein
MILRPSRRDIVKATATVAAIGAAGVGQPAFARAQAPTGLAAGTFSHVDSMPALQRAQEKCRGRGVGRDR